MVFNFVPLTYNSVFVPVPYCFHYCSFVWSELRESNSSKYIFLSQGCFGYLGSFVGPYKLKEIYYRYGKNTIDNLIGIALNLYIVLGSIVILTILILPIQEHYISFQPFVASSISFISVI